MKNITQTFVVLLLLAPLYACSSPEEKAASYVANAEELFEQGQIAKAEIEYKNALQVNQNIPDAWYGLARIHERKQEWRKAYAVLNKVQELAPNHVKSRIMLGQIRLASGQIDQALEDAKEILTLAPEEARAHALMAAVQFRLENNEGALEQADKALALEPGNNEALLVRARIMIAQKSYDQALDLLDQAIKSNPDNVSYYLMKIQAYQESDNPVAIEKVYTAMIGQFPENIGFKHALARYYMSQKRIDDAEAVLQKIVEADPANVDEKIRLIGFKYQFRSFEDAVALTRNYATASPQEFRYRFLLAELYEKNDRTDEALGVYQAIVNDDGLNTNGIEARNKIALLEIRAGNNDRAKALADEVLGHDKANENALLLKSGFQISEQQYDDAIVNLRTVLRDNPQSTKALGLLGRAYDANGSSQLAEESYTKAYQIQPGSPVIANQLGGHLMRKGKIQQADEILMQSLSSGNRSVATLRLLTQAKLALGEWDKAEQLAKQLEQVEGQEALSQQVLGIVYQGKEQQEQSIDAFKKAHELSPTASQPIVSLVQSYVRDGKANEARKFLNSVLSDNEKNLTAHLLLGQLSLYEKKTPEAIQHFERAIKANPNADMGYRSLSAVYLRGNEPGKAEAVLKRGLKANPDQPVLLMTLASVYERSEQFAEAIALYESMLEKNPNQIVAKNNLASLLTDYGTAPDRYERARTISAEFKDSQIPQFRDTYAWASVKAGTNLEEAVVILEGIVKDNEQVDVYHYHLGEAYRAKGDNDNALAYLNKAVELARPGSPVAKQAAEALQQLK